MTTAHTRYISNVKITSVAAAADYANFQFPPRRVACMADIGTRGLHQEDVMYGE